MLLLPLFAVASTLLTAQIKTVYENGHEIEVIYQPDEFDPGFTDMEIDDRGYLWLVNGDRFARYDGYDFEYFKPEIPDPKYKLYQTLHYIYQDSRGIIWIATPFEGMIRYDPHYMTYDRTRILEDALVDPQLQSILEDKAGSIWMGYDEGLIRIDPEGDLDFEMIQVPSTSVLFKDLIDSLRVSEALKASMIEIGNNEYQTLSFEIDRDTSILILAQGELDYTATNTYLREYVDYGWITDASGHIIWKMEVEASEDAGRFLSSRLHTELIRLQAGQYELHFRTNESFAFGDWIKNNVPSNPSPLVPEWWGIQVFEVDDLLFQVLQERKVHKQETGRLASDGTDIFKDSQGTIWIYGQSLQRLEIGSDGDYRFIDVCLWSPKEAGCGWNTIWAMEEKDTEHLWISGLATTEDHQDRFIIGFVNKSTGRFTEVETGLPAQAGQGELILYTTLHQDNLGNLWIGGALKKGLYKLSPPYKPENLIRFDIHHTDPVSGREISIENIYAFAVDHTNHLWIGTSSNQLYKLYLDHSPVSFVDLSLKPEVENYNIGGYLVELDNHTLWTNLYPKNLGISSNWGLIEFNYRTGEMNFYFDSFFGFPCQNMYPVTKLSGGSLLLNNMQIREFIEFDPIEKKAEIVDFNGAETSILGRGGKIFNDSLIYINTGYLIHTERRELWIDLRDIIAGSAGSWIRASEPKDGVFWLGRQNGELGQFKINGRKLDTLQLFDENELTNQLFEDQTGELWQTSNGTFKSQLGPDGFERIYDETNGLLQGSRALHQDSSGRFWVFASKGIGQFDPTSGKVVIPRSLSKILPAGGHIASDDTFIIKSRDGSGYYIFNVHDLVKDTIPPRVIIEGLTVLNEEEQSNGIEKPVEVLKGSFPYWKNDLSMDYKGLQFNDPEQISYQYQLQGLSSDWQQVASLRNARFLNLPPGKYTFKVKAANADGVWSEPTGITFEIRPPWYWAWWSKSIYALLVIGALAYWINSLRRKVRQKEEQLRKEQAFSTELKELNEANQRFVPVDFLEILGKESLKDLHLGEHTRTNMTILFSDIRSYTTLSETMSADDNFKFINGYLGRVGPVIKKHGGFISSYMGDGLMALFLDDHQGAAQAAIEMQKVLEKYNLERVSKGREPINTGVGLNTGDLMLGIIGDQDRYDSTVISDAVNTASRMEGLTKIFGAAIIVSEKTLQELRDEDGNIPFAYRPLGKVRVKGKEQAVAIYDLYEGEFVAMRQLKARTQDNFEKGINHYFHRQFGKAAEAFKVVLENNPDDLAAQYYVDKCVDYIVNDVPEGWNGIEEMVMK